MLDKIKLLIIPIIFLVSGVYTLPNYGVNWDNPYHFNRGQSYLRYFLTGQKDYKELPTFEVTSCTSGNLDLFTKCNDESERRSYYQYDPYDFEYWIKNDSGHPPLNDILASLGNYIFYQKLGLINDTLSHNIFMIVSSFLLVLGIAYFVKLELGTFPAIISSLVLASYPLFFSESHFNVKDPPETAFFGLTLIFFYLGIVKNNWKFIILSSVVAGLALGIKLNIVFAILIITPWILFYLKNVQKLFMPLIIYLPIALGIVYVFWPYLWQDPLINTLNILGYYGQIGVGTPAEMSNFIFHKWNLYPIYWISVTTTLPVLFLTLVGILSVKFWVKLKKGSFYLFVILWFLVPIIRGSWPNAVVYGGVRQIMEYVPALAILSGMGAYFLINYVNRYVKGIKILTYLIIIIGLGFSVYEIVQIHPNENIYFNQLVGGLKGAKNKNIPYWGNTYGSVYLQGVKWINENAEIGAKVSLPLGVMSNIPRTMLRSDIDYIRPNWSGINREGEYGIEMYFEWPMKYWYTFQYYDQYLEPVYTYSVDGAPLLKVWKNDLEHTRSKYKEEDEYLPKKINYKKNTLGTDMQIDLGKEVYITKLIIKHAKTNCQNGLLGYIALSNDGKDWQREIDPITYPQVAPNVDPNIFGWNDSNFIYFFAGKKARYIILDPQIEDSCLLQNSDVSVFGLRDLP